MGEISSHRTYPHPQFSSRPEAPHALLFGARISDLIFASAEAAPLGTARPRWMVNREGEERVPGRVGQGCVPWNGTLICPVRVHPLPLGSPNCRGAELGGQEGVVTASPSGAVLWGTGPPVSPRSDREEGHPVCESHWDLDFTSGSFSSGMQRMGVLPPPAFLPSQADPWLYPLLRGRGHTACPVGSTSCYPHPAAPTLGVFPGVLRGRGAGGSQLGDWGLLFGGWGPAFFFPPLRCLELGDTLSPEGSVPQRFYFLSRGHLEAVKDSAVLRTSWVLADTYPPLAGLFSVRPSLGAAATFRGHTPW